MGIKLYLNVVSLLTVKSLDIPVTTRPFQNLDYLLWTTLEAGYDGAQIAPIRTAKPDQDFLGLDVLAEEAWNPVWSWIQTLPGLRKIPVLHGAEGMPAYPQDYAIFPNPRTCARVTESWRQRGIPFISHHFGRDELVEFGPQLGMSHSEVAAKCNETGSKLVIDTKHLKQYLDSCERKPNPEEVVDELAPFTKGLHVQPLDVNAFIQAAVKGCNGYTIQVTESVVSRASGLDFITAEYRPEAQEILSPAISLTQAVRVRQALEQILG